MLELLQMTIVYRCTITYDCRERYQRSISKNKYTLRVSFEMFWCCSVKSSARKLRSALFCASLLYRHKSMKLGIVWTVTPCRLAQIRLRFEITCYFHLQRSSGPRPLSNSSNSSTALYKISPKYILQCS